MRSAVEFHGFALGVNLVLAVSLVPFGNRRVLVHVLEDLSPADSRVVGTEGNLPLLCGVGDDAHLGAAEVVIEQVLKPHAGDKEKIPRVGTALERVFISTVGVRGAILLPGPCLARKRKGLVELL